MVQRRTVVLWGIICGLVLIYLSGTVPVFGLTDETVTPISSELADVTLLPSESTLVSPPAEETEITIVETTEEPTAPSFTFTPTTAIPTPTEVSQRTVRILVGTNDSVNVPRRLTFSNDQTEIELAKIGVHILDVPAEESEKILQDLKDDPAVAFAELNGEVQALEVFPNDPYYPSQSGLTLIRASQGWMYSTGSDRVTIAIIDSGVDLNHPDLIGKILPGYDFVNDDDLAQDDYGHGTHVAGIAAGTTNNGIGISGVSWGANILPVKVLDYTGSGYYADVAAAIIWATDNGAQIINLSLGGVFPNETLELAVNYATARNVLVIASAGNYGSPELLFPAAYRDVVAVGSVNDAKHRSYFSNYGNGLDLMAPGENIYSTIIGGYGYKNGTSMSAPFVSGMAAILWGIPGYGYANLVEAQMETTALDLGAAGWDGEYGFGLIQLDAALEPFFVLFTPTSNPPTPQPFTATVAYYGQPVFQSTLIFQPTASVTVTQTVSPTLTASSPSTPDVMESQVPLKTTAEVTATSPGSNFSWLPFFCGLGLILIGAVGMFWAARLKRKAPSRNSSL